MKVNANVLLNYIRCRRYASLNDPEYDYTGHNASSLSSKYFQKYKEVFEDLYFTSDVNINYDYELSYNFHADIDLHETIDFYTENNKNKIGYCLIPSTSSELLRQKYNVDKHKYQLFVQDDHGVFILNKRKSDSSSNYEDKITKITDRHDDIGRIVYTYAFKYFVYQLITGQEDLKLYFIMLNTNYIFNGESYEYGLFHVFDFSELYNHFKENIEADIYRMINHIELNDFTECLLVKNECNKGDVFQCKFVDFCFSHIPKENSVMDYFDAYRGFTEPLPDGEIQHETYDLINNGYVDMLDIPISWLEDEKHLMQRYCTETDSIYVNKDKIEYILKTLRYPLIYLDFEALPSIIPKYKGETPYTQSVFQYSIHIEQTEGDLDINDVNHFEYLANPSKDSRRELLESMIKILTAYNSSIVVYHKTFESQRLKEMQEIFPEYKEELQNIIERLFDLKDVVKNNKKFFINNGFSDYESSRYNLYSSILSGSYSLKKVIKIFNPDAYENLNISDGVKAYKTYFETQFMNQIDRDKAIKDLLEYCKQDTYSMFEIIHGLKKYLSPGFKIQ